MKRNALVLTLVTVALTACGGDESRTPSVVPDPVPSEQALELIRSCRVSMVEGSHSGEIHLSLKSGRRVRVADPSEVWETAGESSEECPDMEFATE